MNSSTSDICIPGTVLDPADDRVIQSFENFFEFQLDGEYKKTLPQIHGGIPMRQFFRQFFRTKTGVTRRLGRFLYFVDSSSTLSDPPRPTRDDNRIFDERVYDLGIPYICGQWLSPESNPEVGDNEFDFFFTAERLVPFGALFTNDAGRTDLDPNAGGSLHNFDLPILDTVCFDRATTPYSIVVCHGRDAAALSCQHAWEPDAVANYTELTDVVADSFAAFLGLLSSET